MTPELTPEQIEFRKRVTVVKLPRNLGYSAHLPSQPIYGACWGDNEEDAIKALELFVADSHNSEEVLLAN